MTEYESVKHIEKLIEKLRERKFYENKDEKDIFEMALVEAVIALNDVKSYRMIGPVAEFRGLQDKLEEAEEDIKKMLRHEYDTICHFCLYGEGNNNVSEMCEKDSGKTSWCRDCARWNKPCF